jgi:hypothetical protein
MKEIKDMNLAECINRLRELPDGTIEDQFDMRDLPWIFDVAEELADRIHELTRWIPVSERMPEEGDANQEGYVEFWSTKYGSSYYYKYESMPKIIEPELTHWKRITPPEGV